jgi:hypothetical protein
MNNNIQILYNNVNLFKDIAPTPFISVDQEYINFNTGWNQITKISMDGQITGKSLGILSYYELNSGLNLLINRLSNNYGSLAITENSENLFSGNNVIIDSITTEQNSFYGILPFTVDFEIYETGLFTNYYGVTNPEESIDFSEEDGLIVNLTHSISAQGLKIDSNNAITNAKNWVLSRTGNFNKIVPIMVRTGNGSNFLLNSVKESVDRFNATYKWEGSYKKSTSPESPQNAILNYSLDLSSGIEDGVITVGLQGSFENNGIDSLRSEYLNYNFYYIANEASKKTFNKILNSNPISQSVTEQPNNNSLNFNLSYNSDLSSNIINNYTVSIDTDSVKNFSNVSLSATISAKYGDIGTRWNLVQDYYDNNFNPFSLANTEYLKEKSKPLFPNSLTERIVYNEYNAEINYESSWSNKGNILNPDILQLTSSIKYSPSLEIHVEKSSISVIREHNVHKLGTFNQSTIDINVSAVAKPNKNIGVAIDEVEKEISRIKSVYNVKDKFLLIDRNETKQTSSKAYSVNEKYLYEGQELT